jgi:hypothetical protein
MGQQIIKQPKGGYAIFSTIVDNITHYDMTKEDIIEELLKEERNRITEKVNKICDKLDAGENPYYQFTLSIEDCLGVIEEVHGEKERKEVEKLIK